MGDLAADALGQPVVGSSPATRTNSTRLENVSIQRSGPLLS